MSRRAAQLEVATLTDYFGNEAGDAAFYVAAALLLDVPRARARRRRA